MPQLAPRPHTRHHLSTDPPPSSAPRLLPLLVPSRTRTLRRRNASLHSLHLSSCSLYHEPPTLLHGIPLERHRSGSPAPAASRSALMERPSHRMAYRPPPRTARPWPTWHVPRVRDIRRQRQKDDLESSEGAKRGGG